MSAKYHAVHLDRQKRLYDLTLAAVLLSAVAAYAGVTLAANPNVTPETIFIRSTAVSAFVLLHVILCIGPLARFDARFLPLLYNRRHLGVTMFLLALAHAAFAVVQFHAAGDTFPLVSIFTAYAQDAWSLPNTPFEPFGFLALVILFYMAATSHDFWLRMLGASWWKTLHVLVYVAYGCIVVHVAYGFLQSETDPLYVALIGAGLAAVLGLHLAAFARERRLDRAEDQERDGFLRVCSVSDLDNGVGHCGYLRYDRVAIYLVGDRVYALSNACRHQAGPIGEGRLVNGLVTCPWHGWNYRPEDGVSPPPFEKEMIPTYRVRVADGGVFVHPDALPLATKSAGAPVEGGESVVIVDAN